MPFEPFTFDDSVGRTEPSRARVPEGYYLVECDLVEPTEENYAKTTGMYFTWRIVQGPAASPSLGVGGRLRDYNTLKKDAQFGIGQSLGAVGLERIAKALPGRSMPTYQHLQALAAQISQYARGKRAVALIADQPGQTGRPFSGIESLFPADRWDDLRGSAVMRTPTAPAPFNGGAGAAMPTSGSDDDVFAEFNSRI
jgi:hypothetical protein